MRSKGGREKVIVVTGRLAVLFLVMGLLVIALGRMFPGGLTEAEYLLVVLLATACVAVLIRRPLTRM